MAVQQSRFKSSFACIANVCDKNLKNIKSSCLNPKILICELNYMSVANEVYCSYNVQENLQKNQQS